MSLSFGIDLTLRPVHYLLTRAVASGSGGWGAGEAVLPGTVEPNMTVDGFVLFRLSYFDCSDFSIFMGEDTPLEGSCLRQPR